MLYYAYKGKRLQEKKGDATDAALQKMRRRYGAPYMQPAFFELPGDVLLQQYYTGDKFTIGYDCFDLRKSIPITVKAAAGTLVLLYPIDSTIVLPNKNKKITCRPPYYLLLNGNIPAALSLQLPKGMTRYFYTVLQKHSIAGTSPYRPRTVKGNKKITRIIEGLLYCNLQGQALELFVTARTNDLIRYYLATQRRQKQNIHEQRLEQIREYIQEHPGELLTDKILAEQYGSSISVFRKAFKIYFKCAPHQYVLSRRLEKAISLLTETSLPIHEIAWMIGFADEKNLNRTLVRHFNHPPSWFRKK